MKSKTYKSMRGYVHVLFLIMMVMFSCDQLTEDDGIRPELTQSDYYTIPGSSLIIDISSLARQSYTNVDISISKMPDKGILTQADKLLLKYKPLREFVDGEDQFVLTTKQNGKFLATQTVTIHLKETKEELPCGIIPVEDMVEVKPGSSVPVLVLDNDWLCGATKSDFKISVHLNPLHGQCEVDGESIHYTPHADFKDQDEFIYALTSSADGSISYGIVSIVDKLSPRRQGPGNFKELQIPGKNTYWLLFVNENIGFVGTDKGLLKTVDGAETWNEVYSSESFELVRSSLFFLDDHKGFVGYDWGNFMTTSDGGSTWKNFSPFDGPVLSIFFTSQNTGYVGVYKDGDLAGMSGYGVSLGILKTEDGGETWKEVLSPDLSAYGFVDIKFVDANTGYTILSNQLFKTTDAGETWSLIDTNELYNLTVTKENNLFAIWPARQTTIVTSHTAGGWRDAATFPAPVWGIGFSPSSELGFALVWNSNSNLIIYETYNNGRTWFKGENFNFRPNHSLIGVHLPSNNVAYFHFYSNDAELGSRIIKYSSE